MRRLVEELKRIIADEDERIPHEDNPSRAAYRRGYRDACRYALDAILEALEMTEE